MANYVTVTSDKSKTVAFLLCLFFGYLGIHYFFNSDYDKAMKYALHMMDYDLTYGSGDQIFSACAKGKPKTAARMRAEHRPL